MNDHPPSRLPLRVTVQDLRTARYCLAGVRPWFRRQGLDWQDFLDHGIEAARLRATEDALVDPVILVAEARAVEACAVEARAVEARTAAPEPIALGGRNGR